MVNRAWNQGERILLPRLLDVVASLLARGKDSLPRPGRGSRGDVAGEQDTGPPPRDQRVPLPVGCGRTRASVVHRLAFFRSGPGSTPSPLLGIILGGFDATCCDECEGRHKVADGSSMSVESARGCCLEALYTIERVFYVSPPITDLQIVTDASPWGMGAVSREGGRPTAYFYTRIPDAVLRKFAAERGLRSTIRCGKAWPVWSPSACGCRR